uniref:Uncharacterized protein n=1 Tax=Spongospora subterranea TaxID=70186 RepID=A0A0H5QHM3_9EUKA|eukprot:CRZ01478.1 hypothetical protein [Spongospora subterranea]
MLVQSASKAVEDEYSDMTHNTNELLDFTDFSACRNLLKITAMATVDSMVWCLVNTLVLIVFTAMLIVWPLVEVGIKAFMLLVFKLGFCYDPPQTIRSPCEEFCSNLVSRVFLRMLLNTNCFKKNITCTSMAVRITKNLFRLR